MRTVPICLAVCVAVGLATSAAAAAPASANLLRDPQRFPIGVWLQSPARAAEFRAIGINFYIGLWQGPTENQLAALKSAGMPVVCEQNAVALAHRSDPRIIGWMHMDEPDNAQPDGRGGYGPPVEPTVILQRYRAMRAADPTRPVVLNLGQGVAWDRYYGRGVRTNKPEDYPLYARGADIISFDVYPVVSSDADVRGRLWLPALGTKRLVEWTAGLKPVWNAVECTRISSPTARPTPAQVRAEVWMAIIHGCRGLIYFVHQFPEAGRFIEAAVLEDREMCEGLTRLNRQIQELAPVINSPTLTDAASAASSRPDTPLALMAKRRAGALYLFAAAMREGETTATFRIRTPGRAASAEALGEGRTVPIVGGQFVDAFAGYGVHIYRIIEAK